MSKTEEPVVKNSDKKSEDISDKNSDKKSEEKSDKSSKKSSYKVNKKPHFNAELSKKLVDELLEGKVPAKEKPLLVGLFGPQGSGKGYLVAKTDLVKKSLGLGKNDGIIISNIHYLEMLPESKKGLADCKKYYNTLSSLPSDETDVMYNKCLSLQKQYNNQAWNLIFKNLLEEAKKKKLNIFYDFSGRNMNLFRWMAQDLKSLGYKIAVVYPIADSPVLYERLLNVAKKTGSINSTQHVDKLVEESQHSIREIYNLVDELFIYDNNNEPKKILEMKRDPNGKVATVCTIDEKFLGKHSNEFKAFVEEVCAKGATEGKKGSSERREKSNKSDVSNEPDEADERATERVYTNNIWGGDDDVDIGITGSCDACGGFKRYTLIVAVICLLIILLAIDNVSSNLGISKNAVLKWVAVLGLVIAVLMKWLL